MPKKKHRQLNIKKIPWKIISLYLDQKVPANRQKLKYFIRKKVKEIIRFSQALTKDGGTVSTAPITSESVIPILPVKPSVLLLDELQTDSKQGDTLRYETTRD